MSKEELEKLVQQLGAQVATLNARLAALEQPEEQSAAPQAAAPPEPQPQPAPPSAPPPEQYISEEVLLAISAAVAAFLGERAHVRAVRLIGTTRWSQEGRVSIQASHRLERG